MANQPISTPNNSPAADGPIDVEALKKLPDDQLEYLTDAELDALANELGDETPDPADLAANQGQPNATLSFDEAPDTQGVAVDTFEIPSTGEVVTTKDDHGQVVTSQIITSWKAPEFLYFEKNNNWYIMAALVAAGLIAYSIFAANYLMTFVIVMLGIIVFLTARQKPRTAEVIIHEHGLILDDKSYEYEDLNGFWVEYRPPFVKSVVITTRNPLTPKVVIHLEDQDPALIRNILALEVAEDPELAESTGEILSRYLRF